MVELLIIADDLTGAIETGVQVAKQGISTKVIHNPDADIYQILNEIECKVLVINTESRHIDCREAARRVERVVKMSKEQGIRHFYKKTDSTMRGNVGAELEAFQKETGQNCIPFIPAHPKLRRFTKEGYHFIGDQLLHLTEFGEDPLEPIQVSFIPQLLQEQTTLRIELIPRSKPEFIPIDSGILVMDCESENDLEEIGSELLQNDLHKSIAGSAAMCELLPSLYNIKSEDVQIPEYHEPTLLVNGSLNKISRNQIRLANENGIEVITLPEKLLSDSSFQSSWEFRQILSKVKEEMQSGRNVIVSTTIVGTTIDQNINNKDSYEIVSKQIGSVVAVIFDELKIRSLFVIGGDTLMGIMNCLHSDYLTPVSEILPGVAFSLFSFKKNSVQMITKPGGYGDENVIIKLFNAIKESIQ